ncbi:MAG: FixH family protein [Actinomycetota bacterium]|nr:FixH family protein [Actinomycetota bacterium]
MRRIWRLGLVAAAAVAGFYLAIVRFSDAAEEGCAQRVREDLSYEVRWDEQPRMDLTRYRLSVTRAGRPVRGAEVCLNASMKGMSAMAVTDHGREVAPGSYEVSLIFEMGGRWPGRVLIAEPGRGVVAVPLDLQVIEAPAPATGAP